VRVRIQCTAVCALTLTGTHQDDELASEDGRTTTRTERVRPPDGWRNLRGAVSEWDRDRPHSSLLLPCGCMHTRRTVNTCVSAAAAMLPSSGPN
jgi:hypothetical protein